MNGKLCRNESSVVTVPVVMEKIEQLYFSRDIIRLVMVT